MSQSALETTFETALVRVKAALATLRTGLAAFGPDGSLLFANPRFGELFGVASAHAADGVLFSHLLDVMAAREPFAAPDGAAFIATQREVDRSRPSTMRRTRIDGHVVDIVSDPLPDGGWALTVTDVSPLATGRGRRHAVAPRCCSPSWRRFRTASASTVRIVA